MRKTTLLHLVVESTTRRRRQTIVYDTDRCLGHHWIGRSLNALANHRVLPDGVVAAAAGEGGEREQTTITPVSVSRGQKQTTFLNINTHPTAALRKSRRPGSCYAVGGYRQASIDIMMEADVLLTVARNVRKNNNIENKENWCAL